MHVSMRLLFLLLNCYSKLSCDQCRKKTKTTTTKRTTTTKQQKEQQTAINNIKMWSEIVRKNVILNILGWKLAPILQVPVHDFLAKF